MQAEQNRCTIHGVFLSVLGVGTLIVGESGVGKSECALELVSRGHMLIADDAINIDRADTRLFGTSPELLSGLLEIRGLGIIDVRQMFGDSSVGGRQAVDLCIEFTNMDIGRESDRIAGDTEEFETLGGEIPKYVLSVHPGRPLALLVETAVKLLAQDNAGFNAERVLIANYNKAIAA